jgi:DNA-binding IclR family transcriptional regulator
MMDIQNPAADGGLVRSIDRAVRILEFLEASPHTRFTVTQIARALGLPKSTTFNLCGALVDGQLLRRSHDGFQLGRRLVQLGSAYVSSIDLVREFYEVCRAAPADLGATIQLSVLDEGFNAVYLAYQDCGSGLRLGLSGGVGRVVPANCSASGKALLAALGDEALEQRLAKVATLPGLTAASITSMDRLRRELAAIRRRGYSTDEGGTVPGLSCVAGTARTSYLDGDLVAVSITAAKDSLTAKRTKQMREMLLHIVGLLQARL